jgi:hypothetical protein
MIDDWDMTKRRQEDEFNGRWGGRYSQRENTSRCYVVPIMRPMNEPERKEREAERLVEGAAQLRVGSERQCGCLSSNDVVSTESRDEGSDRDK